MALNVLHPNIEVFTEILDSVCTREKEGFYRFLPDIGEGFLKSYQSENWQLYLGEFKITQDIRIQREGKVQGNRTYSIGFRTFKEQLDNSQTLPDGINSISEGIVLNSNESSINNIWQRNTNCRIVFMLFNEVWIESLENNGLLPPLVRTKLEKTNNPVFHVALSPEMKQNLRQMLYTPSEIQGDFLQPYLHNKSIELFLQSASLVVNRVERQVRKLAVHPEDLNVLEQIKVQIVNNYQEPPQMSDLVEQTGMSKSKLQRLFQKVYHTSVYQFIKQVRMEKAMELLMQGYSVTEAGYDVGYSSIPNFSAAFKEHFNIQPGQVAAR